MKMKITVLLILAFATFSCRKEYVSLNHSIAQRADRVNNQNTNSENNIYTPLGEAKEAAGITSKEDKNIFSTKKVFSKEEKKIKKPGTSVLPFSEIKKLKKEIKKRKKEKKEMDPRLSRALVMTIGGGAAVILGIALYGVAPTGLFIFAFSFVFLVGLVSLILYWANPKPKM
jgi:activator of 2-hydroxyglutaryl-CoA dehydratase